MADLKISQLNSIVTVVPATDVLPVVQGGTTYKVTPNQLLGAGGTATLASATITGALTVDTSTLVVDATNNRVGIGTASPGAPLDIFTNNLADAILIRGNDNANVRIRMVNSGAGGEEFALSAGIPSASNSSFVIRSVTAASNRYIINQTGEHAWATNAGTAMTLNSTGLGIGGTPTTGFLTVGSTSNVSATTNALTILSQRANLSITANGATDGAGTTINYSWANGGQGPLIFRNAAIANVMTLDASGNLLVGVASSGNRLDIQKSTDCTLLVKSTGANTNIGMDYVSSYGNHTIRKSGTAVWDYGVINDSSATPAFKISNGPSAVGVQLVSGATAWTTLSDETVKDIIEPITNAITKVGSLRSVIGKFKTDDANKRRSFLIAQDVLAVLPEAVDVIGENNELGLRYTEVIPLLVAAIQELTSRVQTLEAR